MANYTYKQILSKAKSIKKEVETTGVVKTSPKWSYYIASAILRPNTDITKISFDNATSPSKASIKKTIPIKNYTLLIRGLISFVNGSKHRLPNYMNYAGGRITRDLYTYMLAKILVFYSENKRLPNTVSIDSSKVAVKKKTSTTSNCTNPYKSSPHYLGEGCNKLGQCTSSYCAPHSFHQILRKFGVTNISESTLAGWAGTTSSGTDHAGVETMIAKAGKKSNMVFKVQWFYMSDFGKTTDEQFKALAKKLCQKNVGIFFHIGYQGNGSTASGTVFGHYEVLDQIDIVNKKVRALNSLGSKCGSGYCGHTQWRSFSLQKQYINNKSGVKSVCIVTKM